MSMREDVVLINKRPFEFVVNYPNIIDGVPNPSWVFPPAKNGRTVEKGVPYEVYDWLKTTDTFRDGYLLIKESKSESDEETIKYDKEEFSDISSAIKSEKEIEEILKKGNQNVLKGKLNELIKDIDDDNQVKEIKSYIWNTCLNIGIDSTSKRKVVCEFCGRDYEEVKDVFDEE